MRLLHCIRSLNPSGGGPIEALRQRLGALRDRGHESEVACLDAPAEPWLADFPAPVQALGPGRGGYGYSARWMPWLRANRHRFDAVIINGLWQFNSFGTRQALGAAFPYFVFPHGMLDPWFKRTYPLKHLKKWLYWPWAEYRVLRDARAVFFTSEEERRQARESFWLYHCREAVVNYGTAGPPGDLAQHRRDFLAAFPELGGKKILLFLGRLHEKKGLDLLCEAWARVRSAAEAAKGGGVEVVIAGPGSAAAEAAVRESIARLRLAGTVRLTGMLTGSLKWGALAAADAFVLPSHQENFGVAVAEALACGTPVLLSTRVNIWREIVADGAGCAEPDTPEGTARLLRTWLDEPAEQWRAKRSSARACFEARFTIARSAESLIREISAHLR